MKNRDDRRMGTLCFNLTYRGDEPWASEIVKAVAESNPSRKVKAQAIFCQGCQAYGAAFPWGRTVPKETRDPLLEKARALFTEAATYSDAETPDGKGMIAAKAMNELHRLDNLPNLKVGGVAPEITGTDLDGKPLKLSDHRGKVVVVVFWGSWCGPCMAMVPHEKELWQRHKDKSFALFGVNCGDTREEAKKTATAKGMGWPSWYSGEETRGDIAIEYDVQHWPTVFVIDAKGVIRFIDVRDKELEEAVDSLLVEKAAPNVLEKVAVTCVDSDGKPISGAEVYLFQFTGPAEGGRFVQSGPFMTDDGGRAECSDATLYDGDKYDRWFYARVPGRLVGAGRTAKWTNRAAFNTESRVVLRPSRVIDGRVVVPAGFDPAKVTVSVRTLQIMTGAGPMDYQTFTREDQFPGLDKALPGIFECRPDAQGRIRFADVPERGRLYLVSRGAGLAEAQWSNSRNRDGQFPEPILMEIEEESLLSGRVLSPDGKPAAGMKVTARLSASGRRQNAYLSSFNAISDDDGRFVVHGLPETEFGLAITDPTKRWSFRPMESLLVRPRQDPALTLNMEVGVRVSGMVTGPDGKPVEGAAISAVADDHGGPGLSDDMTDANGRYELRLPIGEACFYFNSLPDGFEYPKPQIAKRLQIKSAGGDIKNFDFTIERRSK